MKKLSLLGAVCACLFFTLNVNAAYIVDTGTPTGGPGWSFGDFQYFGGEFTIADSQTINSIESYFSSSTSGLVDISIHSDGGNVPGGTLFSTQINIGASTPLDWHGASGLNWSLGAGTYWVSFIPDADITGTMPGTAPNPLDEYAQGNSLSWTDVGADSFDYLDIGFRIASPVPVPGAVWLFGSGLLGLVGIARRKKAA